MGLLCFTLTVLFPASEYVQYSQKNGLNMHQDLLYTIAEVAVTLAGFSGVVFILGNRAQGNFSNSEKNGLFHLLFTTCGNMIVVLIVAACI